MQPIRELVKVIQEVLLAQVLHLEDTLVHHHLNRAMEHLLRRVTLVVLLVDLRLRLERCTDPDGGL